MDLDPRELSSGELALRIATAGDARAYFFFLACAANAQGAVGELVEEIRATDLEVVVDSIAPSTGAGLLAALPEHVGKLLVIDATAYVASDWRTLDRRRSSLVHDKALVFVTTVGSFGILMQQAPHLASWLGGEVFAMQDHTAEHAEIREQRLAALRSWSGKSDENVIAAAAEQTLPRDPEYAEWLVLLGRGDLLDA